MGHRSPTASVLHPRPSRASSSPLPAPGALAAGRALSAARLYAVAGAWREWQWTRRQASPIPGERHRESAVNLPWEGKSSMRRLPEIVAFGALLAILILRAPLAGAAPSHQDDDDPWWMGVSLAMTNANGQWTGQWLGAHRYTREGGLYVVVMADASWDRLQQALATTSPAAAYVLGDTPYVGDGMCAPGAWRHWWHNGVLTT